MTEPLAFLNGNWIPAREAVVPVYDAGFVLGTTVAEQVRTFGGKLFRLDRHLQRLAHSLQIVGVDPGISLADLGDAARELARHNHTLLDPGDDLGMCIFVTPGPYATMAAAARRAGHSRPLVCMHTNPLPFHLWADKYRVGESLVLSGSQVPAACWPPELKCRSRMHFYLADLHARTVQTGARALLTDAEGGILEASTANIFTFRRGEGICSPPRHKILPGVSISTIAELADTLGVPFTDRPLKLQDLFQADEVMLCSTSPCLWPVHEIDGQRVGQRGQGEFCQRLLSAWSDLIGVEIVAQAVRFAGRIPD